MRQVKKLRLTSLLTVALVLSACVTCYAQTTSDTTAQRSHASPAQDSETLKALEIANIRLAAANETIKLLNGRLSEKDAVIEAKEGTIATKDEVIALLKSANLDRAAVNTGDARVLEACNQQLAKAEARIYALEHPGLLKSIFDGRTLSGFGAGYFTRSLQEQFMRR